MTKPTVTIYTDGGCWPNPGPGGWGAVLMHDGRMKKLSGNHPDTTNNRMEITAAIKALRALKVPCHVVITTDSQYLKNGFTRWLPRWLTQGWITASKEPVKNQDLWEELHRVAKRHEIAWYHAPGHAGNIYNEMADELATAAREALPG